ncbi:HD domain-containing phosphohydrolase [Actinotalea sp. K2]|uniref:HD domain-containing phosphohydrolase n=1 Tax=Actinotalea sp. K2 TaxID=2939438 RepID=UPI00201822AF|nr:HD domain-containing phosphohydrolase [Actinotalea sp. K2]MCL3862473.1 HD domain-containing protein [Actinotalea sp. K2]
MASGPTQNYEDVTLGRWKPHPALAVVVRIALRVLPIALAIGFGWAVVSWMPPERLGWSPWVWLPVQVALSTALFLLGDRVARKLLPLTSLLRLTLYFPDRAPSRLAVTVRHHSPQVLRDRIDAVVGGGEPLTEEYQHAVQLLELVSAISEHDRTTRGHCERVQAYSALIGTELGLSAQDAAKLSWAALLHDVGKLRVPAEILNKSGRPDAQEWQVLAGHPSHGAEIAAPLAAWLGPWLGAIGEHHERWDGAGYPQGLAGTAISRAARIVAVADAYDVITSARSYKRPLSAAAARAELARCAGSQFDPEVVRAFLAVGLGRLRLAAGPLSVLSGIPALHSMGLPQVGTVVSGGTSSVATGTAMATAAVVGTALTLTGPFSPDAQASGPVPAPPALTAEISERASAPGSVAVPGDTDASPSGTLATDPSDTSAQAADPSGQPADAVGQADPTAVPADPAPMTRDVSTDGSATASAPSPPGAPAPSARPDAGPPPERPGATPTTGPPAATNGAPSAPVQPESPCTLARGGGDQRGAQLGRCDLSGRTVTGDFSGADLAGADLSGATLTGVSFAGARLNGADLTGATISATSFDDADLTGARFTGAAISGSSFRRATLNPQTLAGAQVTDSAFE